MNDIEGKQGSQAWGRFDYAQDKLPHTPLLASARADLTGGAASRAMLSYRTTV